MRPCGDSAAAAAGEGPGHLAAARPGHEIHMSDLPRTVTCAKPPMRCPTFGSPAERSESVCVATCLVCRRSAAGPSPANVRNQRQVVASKGAPCAPSRHRQSDDGRALSSGKKARLQPKGIPRPAGFRRIFCKDSEGMLATSESLSLPNTNLKRVLPSRPCRRDPYARDLDEQRDGLSESVHPSRPWGGALRAQARSLLEPRASSKTRGWRWRASERGG